MFYNALMLTGVNLLLRLVSTAFSVFISGRMGAAGVGLLQLVMSVASLSMTAGIAGIRTATMYLTAEELGRRRRENTPWVISGCLGYSLFFGGLVAALVFTLAPQIAFYWIGDLRTVGAIRLFGAFLPLSCMTAVMTGFFTADNRIALLAAVEVAEQLASMVTTTLLLVFWAGQDPGRACQAVVMGGCTGGCVTLGCLVFLRLRQRVRPGERVKISKRLANTALPLALADDLKAGISTTENLMVPKRLRLYTPDALAQFGMVCGMVFPVLMFPAAILFGLADLLIPELARCNAAGSSLRIRYLVRRSLKAAALYGTLCGGILFLVAEGLCVSLYGSTQAGQYLRWYACLAPMLYCDAIVDAMTKGLGQQKKCVLFNIVTSAMDVVLLFILLPRWGMKGYFVSFLVTHAINAALSLGLLQRITSVRIRLRLPLALVISAAVAVYVAEKCPWLWLRLAAFVILLGCLWKLLGVVNTGDGKWLLSLWRTQKKREKS